MQESVGASGGSVDGNKEMSPPMETVDGTKKAGQRRALEGGEDGHCRCIAPRSIDEGEVGSMQQAASLGREECLTRHKSLYGGQGRVLEPVSR